MARRTSSRSSTSDASSSSIGNGSRESAVAMSAHVPTMIVIASPARTVRNPPAKENVIRRSWLYRTLFECLPEDRKSTRLNSSHVANSYAVFCLKKKINQMEQTGGQPDVVGKDQKTGEYIFFDCSPESTKGGRSVCYDHEAMEYRKKHKTENSDI